MKKLAVFLIVIVGVIVVAIIVNSPSPTAAVQASNPIPVAVKPPTPADLVAARKAYAKVIDLQLLDMSIESNTRTDGPQATTLVIHDALAGRVRAHQLAQNAQLFEQLRALKFKKLVYTDGEDSDFSWNLERTSK